MPMFPPINPPAAAPDRRGLLAVATDPGLSARWLDGVSFQPDTCAALDPLPWAACAGLDLSGGAVRPDGSQWQPIVLRGFDRCSTLGGLDMADRERRARANLAATASWQAEREFHDGAATAADPVPNPFFTDGTADTVTTTGQAAVALAALEQALAECLHGQRGVIHAPPRVVSLWDSAGQIHMDGGLLVTINDNLVVAGSGYSGDTPDGDPVAYDATMWAYGTSQVFAIRGPVTLQGDSTNERLDVGANIIDTWVAQPALIFRSPCCLVAAEVDVTPT